MARAAAARRARRVGMVALFVVINFAIELSEFISAQQHFDSHGAEEGRLPHPL
jgi:hypothetical protein